MPHSTASLEHVKDYLQLCRHLCTPCSFACKRKGRKQRADLRQMSARSSEQNMTAFSSWQMSHWLPSGCGFSATRSCFCDSLLAECTLRAQVKAQGQVQEVVQAQS